MRTDRQRTTRFPTVRASRPRFAIGTEVIQPIRPDRDGDGRMDEFATIIHDLKNPLATIALEAYLLDNALTGEEQAHLRRAVTRITRNIEFVDRMVENLLDSYCIDAGEFEIRRRPTELATLLGSVVDRAVPTYDRGRVRLEVMDQTTMLVDDLRIERVVANLIGNALKYAPRGSPVVVRLDIGPSAAQVSVVDAGPGMTAAEIMYVFDRHRRTDTARTHEGYGLGLYVSKRIVEAHGGCIGVESTKGEGSRFFFDLPMA